MSNMTQQPSTAAEHETECDECAAIPMPTDRVDPKWGAEYGCGTPAYVTPQGVLVWMHRKGQHVRYFDVRGEQVGPEHGNVYPAILWAAANCWIDPAAPNLTLACVVEVRRRIAEQEALSPEMRLDVERGAWVPAAKR